MKRTVTRTLSVPLLLLAALVAPAATVFGQDVVTGTPAFGTFQSFGPSVLNIGNLNSQVTIPLFSRPGRGAGFHYALAYDNSVWIPKSSAQPGTSASWQPRPQFGWHGLSEGITGYLSYDDDTHGCSKPGSGQIGEERELTRFVYHDPGGVPHSFRGRVVINTTCDDREAITDQFALDGSGYILNFHLDGQGPKEVRFVDGTVIHPPHDPGGSGSVTDSNGNVITATMAGGEGTFIDSLGTTVLAVSGRAPDPVHLAYSDSNGAPQSVALEYEVHSVKTNFGCAAIDEFSDTGQALLSKIVLPDQSWYGFTYETTPGDPSSVTGRIATVTLPTGATISYAYTGDNNGIVCADGSTAGVNVTTADGGTWQYRRAGSGRQWATTAIDPFGNETVSRFSGIYRTQMQAYAGSAAGTPLASVVTCYNAISLGTCTAEDVVPPIGERIVTVTLDNNQQASTRTVYDAAGMPTHVYETTYGSGTPGALARQTDTRYEPLGAYVLSRPSMVTIWDGVTKLTQTSFIYDGTQPTATPGTPQHVGVSGPRGNLTQRGEWKSGTANTFLTTKYEYFDTGMLRSVTDPGGHVTTFDYTDDWNGWAANPSCLPSASSGAFATDTVNSLSQHVRQQYFPCTGQPQGIQDQNDVNASRPGMTGVLDLMNRPLTINFPDGGQASVRYPDPNHVTAEQRIDSGRSANAQIELDAYGRTSRVAQANGESTSFDIQDICYDSIGRLSFQSYPYRAAGLQGPKVCAGAGDSYLYDALGRIASRTHSDGRSIQYFYKGRATRITEEGNGTHAATRVLQTDALGRLTKVCEVSSELLLGEGGTPTSCGLDIEATGFLTSYGYDALGRLTSVTQGNLQDRRYEYNSRGLMTSEFEPETGSTTSYTYNDDGLLVERVRPAPNQTNPEVTVTTTYTYDALHRLLTTSYSDGVTSSKTFSYDETSADAATLHNSVGRLTSAKDETSTTVEMRDYDPVGRVVGSLQVTPGIAGQSPFRFDFEYDLAGHMTAATNGTGIRLDYAYDADGRLSGLASSLDDAKHPGTLLRNLEYGPFGLLSGTLGNGLSEGATYTPRGFLESYSVLGRTPQPPDNTPPVGALDSDGTHPTLPISGSLTVTGWAADNEDGSPVARVSIDIDGITLGNADLRFPRPEVASSHGRTDYLLSGYQFTLSIGQQTPGEHVVHAIAYDSAGLTTVLGQKQITVEAPPVGAVAVDMVPADGWIDAGAPIRFIAHAPYPATFQWFRGTTYGLSFAIDGATTGSFQDSPQSETGYWVRATEPSGEQHDSAIFLVHVRCTVPLVQISTVPSIPTVEKFSPVFLTANAIASGPAYAWFEGETGDTSHLRYTTRTIVVNAMTDVQKLWVRVTDSCGAHADSRTATVYACLPTIATQPLADPPFIPADGSQTATLRIDAGSSNSVPPHFQWYRDNPGALPISIPNSDSKDLAVGAAQAGTYWVDVIGTCSDTIQARKTSERVTVGTCTPPVVTTGAFPSSVERNTTVTLSVTASGPELTYQWYRGAAGDPLSAPIEGAQDSYYTFAAADSGSYWVLVKSNDACQRASATMTVSVCDKPGVSAPIAAAPDVMPGTSTTISVTATGTNLNYQWRQAPAAGGPSQLVGTNASVLTTGPLNQDTTFWVNVNSGSCSRQSPYLTVPVCNMSVHWTTPVVPPAHSGDAIFIGISGSPAPGNNTVAYWYRGTPGDLAHSVLITGPTTATTIVVNPTATTTYWVRLKSTVPNSSCHVDTGGLVVKVCLPRIVQQPASSMIDPGAAATVSVVVDVSPATYQWYAGSSGDTATPIAGATSPSLTITPSATTSYWARATGDCGATADSDAATITVAQPTAIATQPADASITVPGSAFFTVAATGTNLVYQWYQGVAGNTSTPVGDNTATLLVTPPTPTDYWVRVTGARGVVNSRTAHVSVCTTPVITAQPQNQTIFSGAAATLSVSATESTGEPKHYQWFVGSGSGNPVGTDSPSYNTGVLTATTQYRVRVTAGMCLANSALATVSMCSLPQATGAAANQQIAVGGTARLTAPVSAPTGRSFRWFRGNSGDTSAPVGGWVVGNQVDVSPSVTTTYWYQVQDSGGCLSNGGTSTVSVCIPHITQQPSGRTITAGSTTTLSVVSDLPAATYQWYAGASGNTASPVAGGTSATLTVSPTATRDYWVRVSGPCGQSVDSDAATITVAQPTAIVTQPADASITAPGAAFFTVAATGTDLVYQWYQGAAGNTSTPVGDNTATLLVTPPTPTDYWVRLTGAGGVVNSRTAHVSVCTTPVITAQPQNQTIFRGTATALSVSAVESTGEPKHYQWFRGSGLSDPVGTDSSSYNTGVLTATTQYRVRVTAGMCLANSALATVSMCTLLQTTAAAANQQIAVGDTARLTAPVPAGTGRSFRWFRGTSGDTSAPVGGWVVGNQVDVSPSVTTTYWYQVQDSGGCLSNGGTSTVSVCIPHITQQPAGTTIAAGSSTTLSVVSDLPAATYQWYAGASGNTASPVAGATSATLNVSPSATGDYWVRVSGPCGQSVDSAAATVTVCAPPGITAQPVDPPSIPAHTGQVVSLSAVGTDLTYQWYLGQSGDVSSPVSGATDSILTLSWVPYTQYYWARVIGACGSVNSTTVAISVTPTITRQPASTSVVSGSSATLSVGATGTYLHYTWQNITTGQVVGTDSSVLMTAPITAQTRFICSVKSGTYGLAVSQTGTVSLCTGIISNGVTVGAPDPNNGCRWLSINATTQSGDGIAWYKGASGDVSTEVVSARGLRNLLACPADAGSYWYRITRGTCSKDSPAVMAP